MVEYFSHDFRARQDPKMKRLFMEKGLKGLGLYWCLIEMLYEAEGYISLKDTSVLAFEFRTNKLFVEDVIKNYELFKFDNEKFYSESCLKRLKIRNEKKEKARQNINKRWEKVQENNSGNTTVIQTNNGGNTERYKVKVKEKDKYIQEVSTRREGGKKFTPPSLNEITDYCRERNNEVDPQRFKDFYESKGWYVGKNKMKDWKAAIRTWEQREIKQPNKKSKLDVLNEIYQEVANE
jgi:hypothetical protein